MARKKGNPPQSKPVTGSESEFDTVKSERRIKDVTAARTIYGRFLQDDILRSSTIAQVRNQLEGGRPYDPVAFQNQGASWQTNVNFGDAQAQRDRTLLPYWKMVNDVPRRAAFMIDTGAAEQEKWQISFSEAFDEFIEDWGADYFTQYMNMASNFINFGPGFVKWDNPETPRYKAVNSSRVYFPKNTRMSPDEWEVVALVRDVSASELFEKIRDDKAAKNSGYAGWNSDAIKQAIVKMAKGGGERYDTRDYTRIADMLVNNDIAETTPFQPLTVCWLYVRQFGKDGKIGCYCFCQDESVKDFLYKDEDEFESFRHILGAIWYDTGTDGMVHSIKGFGIKNYFFSALLNRMKSRFVDSGTMSMGLNFQYNQENNADETPPVEQYGPFTVFPAGLTQLNIYPQIQQAAGVIEMLSGNQSENNSLYRQQEQQIAKSDTATQANILANMQGELSAASAAIYLSQVAENIYTEQVRRLRIKGSEDKDAAKFVKRLRAKGVPFEVIYDADIRVKTGANAALANPALRAQMFQQDLALMNIPGVNSRWFLENLIANKYGSYAVGKALLPEGVDSNPAQRREAMMENSSFGQGIELPVAPEDAHFEHIEEHLKPVEGILQQFQNTQQVTPEQIAALTVTLEHTGMHMTYLQKNDAMKAQFQMVNPRFRVAQSMVRGILTRMQSQTQGPQPMALTG